MILNEPFLNWLYVTNLTPPTLTLQGTPNKALSRDHLTWFLTIDSVCQFIDIESHQNLCRVRIFFSFICEIFWSQTSLKFELSNDPKVLAPSFPTIPPESTYPANFSVRLTAVRGHSNNTWHFFSSFLITPPPSVTFVKFRWLIFWLKSLWNIKWIRIKVSFKAFSCFVTQSFPSKSIKSSVLKAKKSVCDTSNPSECHVLFEWPLKTDNGGEIFFVLFPTFSYDTRDFLNEENSLLLQSKMAIWLDFLFYCVALFTLFPSYYLALEIFKIHSFFWKTDFLCTLKYSEKNVNLV